MSLKRFSYFLNISLALSPFLSNMTYSKLGVSDNKIIPHLPTEGRENYLEFHRTKILKK